MHPIYPLLRCGISYTLYLPRIRPLLPGISHFSMHSACVNNTYFVFPEMPYTNTLLQCGRYVGWPRKELWEKTRLKTWSPFQLMGRSFNGLSVKDLKACSSWNSRGWWNPSNSRREWRPSKHLLELTLATLSQATNLVLSMLVGRHIYRNMHREWDLTFLPGTPTYTWHVLKRDTSINVLVPTMSNSWRHILDTL